MANANAAEIAISPIESRAGLTGELTVRGAWVLQSRHPHFGGFSAMAHVKGTLVEANGSDGALLLASDRGWITRISLRGGEPVTQITDFVNYPPRIDPDTRLFDLESMVRDNRTGDLWTAYEGANAVVRERQNPYDGGAEMVRRDPPRMRDWSVNSGPEAMARLPDGRFIVMSEGRDDDADPTRPALLFNGDPVEAVSTTAFRFAVPDGYSPVDAAALPDGRLLVLIRRVRFDLPARFDAQLQIVDPQNIAAGKILRGETIAQFAGSEYAENFEGIAYAPPVGDEADASIYLISDDNLSVFQRTILIRLAWTADD